MGALLLTHVPFPSSTRFRQNSTRGWSSGGTRRGGCRAPVLASGGADMVKFGRRLVSERHEEWSEYYIDYKVGPRKKRNAYGKRPLEISQLSTPRGPLSFHHATHLTCFSLTISMTRTQGLKRLVYEAREDPTKVEAYKLGLRGEISKVRATPKNKRFSLP